MEELSSTAELDRQIFDDARKKAAQIKKNADTAIAETKSVWETRLKDELSREEEHFSRQFDVYNHEIEARLTLDKRRIQWKMTEEQMEDAASSFLHNLDKTKLRGLVEKTWKTRLNECFADNFEKKPAQDAVFNADGTFVLDLDEVRITASAEAEIAQMLLARRGELAGAILGNAAKDEAARG
jgi:hypothetical protein